MYGKAFVLMKSGMEDNFEHQPMPGEIKIVVRYW